MFSDFLSPFMNADIFFFETTIVSHSLVICDFGFFLLFVVFSPFKVVDACECMRSNSNNPNRVSPSFELS